jgi:hypothetical protein
MALDQALTVNTPRINLEASWARLGVLFNCKPASRTPDVERLLLETARRLPNARLLPLAATWLATFGSCVARHRLRGLILRELEPAHRPALGLLLEAAIELGAPRDLAIACEVCNREATPRPLFDVHRTSAALASIAEANASELSRRWGLWSPSIELKSDALRSAAWLHARNPDLRDRFVRKGDLRCSILETLRHDLGGVAASESQLARLCAASRAAINKSLASLAVEVAVAPKSAKSTREGRPVRLAA